MSAEMWSKNDWKMKKANVSYFLVTPSFASSDSATSSYQSTGFSTVTLKSPESLASRA